MTSNYIVFMTKYFTLLSFKLPLISVFSILNLQNQYEYRIFGQI